MRVKSNKSQLRSREADHGRAEAKDTGVDFCKLNEDFKKIEEGIADEPLEAETKRSEEIETHTAIDREKIKISVVNEDRYKVQDLTRNDDSVGRTTPLLGERMGSGRGVCKDGEIGRVVINRYPGYLFIHIDQVERFMPSRSDVEGVSVLIESKTFRYETRKCRPWATIGIDEMIKIPVEGVDSTMSLRFVLVLHHGGGISREETRKTCEITHTVDAMKIQDIHNNLVENVSRWDQYTSKNVFKNICSLFAGGTTDAWSLRTYMSFVSSSEVQMIPAPLPHDLRSLSKWLLVKKFSYNTWFKGFVNIRGDMEACSSLWKRRYVKCYGYVIFIFNEHTKKLLGTVNLVEASFDSDLQSAVYSERFLRISVGMRSVEFHFDTDEKYMMYRRAFDMMLPRALFTG